MRSKFDKPVTMEVRLAQPADDTRVGDLLVESFMETYAAKMPEVSVSEERNIELRDLYFKRAHSKVFVGEREGEIVGTVTIFPPGAPTSESWLENAADLRQLALDPAWQGRGLSHALLDRAEAQAREWGCRWVCLHVRRGAHGLVRFYSSRGYRRDPGGDLDQLPSIYLEAYCLDLRVPSQSSDG